MAERSVMIKRFFIFLPNVIGHPRRGEKSEFNRDVARRRMRRLRFFFISAWDIGDLRGYSKGPMELA